MRLSSLRMFMDTVRRVICKLRWRLEQCSASLLDASLWSMFASSVRLRLTLPVRHGVLFGSWFALAQYFPHPVLRRPYWRLISLLLSSNSAEAKKSKTFLVFISSQWCCAFISSSPASAAAVHGPELVLAFTQWPWQIASMCNVEMERVARARGSHWDKFYCRSCSSARRLICQISILQQMAVRFDACVSTTAASFTQ